MLDHGYYEREVLEAILHCLPDGGVLWDVGANIGLHAITVKRRRPNARVVAFEPAPHTAARLMSNAKLNSADVQVVTSALSDARRLAELSIVTRGNSGLTSLRPWPDVRYEATIMCPCERADGLIGAGAVPAPNVVKLDVEGCEAEVLRGFGDLLAAPGLTAIIFEAPGAFAERPDAYPVSAILGRGGFHVRALAPAHPTEKSVPTNFLATRGR